MAPTNLRWGRECYRSFKSYKMLANTQILVTCFKSVPQSYMLCLKDLVSYAEMALSFRSAQPKCVPVSGK